MALTLLTTRTVTRFKRRVAVSPQRSQLVITESNLFILNISPSNSERRERRGREEREASRSKREREEERKKNGNEKKKNGSPNT